MISRTDGFVEKKVRFEEYRIKICAEVRLEETIHKLNLLGYTVTKSEKYNKIYTLYYRTIQGLNL